MDHENVVCSNCKNDLLESDEFCPHCGAMLVDGLTCERHKSVAAAGVCIICARPYCNDCGGLVFGHFLCDRHSMYEIYEGMVRVYGVLDDVAAQYAKSCLEQAGLRAVLYCRTQPRGGPRFVPTLYAAKGDYDGHVVNEIKVMVPCQEVAKAEEVLRDLNITDTPPAGA
jgi:hypothetical protein